MASSTAWCWTATAHKIRGIISASDIVRKLKLPVNIMTDASFLGIFNTVYHPDGV
ncbi:hypothetical protein imdm_2084 [gamma proteobacterium IMCC2047]|nr:hypothetical protein imdm_2084 [gamma proteobacterium IMCC2047]